MIVKVIRSAAPKFYSMGEHGCACAYALDELQRYFPALAMTNTHLIVFAFSIALIAGIVVVIVDKILLSVGVAA